MKRLQAVFEKYLKKIESFNGLKLGAKDEKNYITTEADDQYFKELLTKEHNFNRNVAIFYIILICIYFLIGIILVLQYINSPTTIYAIFGIKLMAILLTLFRLHKIWETKTIIDTTFTLALGLPPEEKVKVIETLYWGSIHRYKK